MSRKYIYNPKTNCLHIEGCCCHAKPMPEYIVFNNENEAVEYDGRAVKVCKICQKNRDKNKR